MLKDPVAFYAEWRLSRVTEVFPDRNGKVHNMEVKLVPSQDKSKVYKPVNPNYLKRHILILIVIVPLEEQKDFNEDD